MPIVQDLQEGQAFQDIPLTPAEQPGALTPEALAAEHAKMRAAFAAKGIEPPPLAPGEKEAVKPADPFAGEKQVDPFHGEQQVHDPFAGERKADALDERTPQDLAADPNFKIHDFVSQNPDVFKDPKRYQKALDTYREQQAQGATLHKTVESVKKDTVPLLKDILKSIPARLENLGEIGGIGKLVNTITMTLRGEGGDPALRAQWENMSEDNKEAAIAEATAGTQTAVGSLQDMVRQGARKLVGPAFGVGGKKDWRTISDEELKNEFFKDLGWKQTVEELSRGEGVKNLVSEGVQLNPENIKLLSLTDPITLVGTGVGLKAVSTGGRILFTAANQAGADAALSYLGRAAGTAAAKTAQAVGQGIEATGQGIKNLLPSSAHGIGTGAFLHMFGVPTKALVAARLAAPVISKTGQLIREVGEAAGAAPKGQLSLGLESTTGAKVLNAAKTAAAFVKPPVVGALEGAATTAPLAFATDEPQGGLLGVGAVGGAVHGAVTGVKGAVAEAGAKRYFDPGQINWEKTSSPGYEGFPGLNAAHEAVSASTPENARNMVDSLRETLRPFGKKLFLVDDASYQKAIEQDTIRANGGQPLTPEQQAAVAQEARSRGVSKINVADDKGNVESVTLVKSSADAPHEFSHVLESVMAPEAREALHDAVREAYTPEELDALKAHYEQQFGRPFTPEEVRSEFIADNWANLLYNTPMESLGLPEAKTTFRQKFLDAAVSMGNALGLDMTAGRKTPGLNLKPSYSLRKALANATGEILAERDQRAAQQATAAPPVQPAEPAPAPAAPVEVPVKPAAEPTAQGELPLFEQPSAPAEATPPASPPAPAPAEATPPAAPSAKRAAVTNTGILTSWSKGKDNEAAVNTVAQAMDQGIGVKMEHAGAPKVTYEPTEPERAAEVEEGRGLPPEQREVHAGEKFLTRAEQTKTGEPQVIARSVDKVVSNIDRAVQWGKAAGETVPWETDANGALTAAGLNQLLADQRTYWDNQDRGFRGGGGKLVRPEGVNVSIPAEKGEGVPLGTEKEQWLNLLQGKDVGPPQTARVVKGQLPANIKAQEIRAAQGDVSERIAPGTNIPIYPEKATQGRGPVEIKETNPLRNRLRAAGMPVGDLHTVVERLNAADIVKAEPAPELQGKGGQTDIARAGYLPEKPVGETVKDVTDATPEQWQKFFGPQGSLTRSAYDLGLGLKDRADLDTLMAAQDAASKTAQATMAEVRAGNFDALDKASADATKAQFFREAIEAATDKGSAAGTSGWRKSHPDAKPPFAEGASPKAFLAAEPKPSEDIRNLADDYAKSAGIDYAPSHTYAEIKPDLSKRLADFYENAKNAPEDPAVQASYKALADETMAQYRAMEAAGYKIEPWEGKGEPYKNSAEAVADIRENKHLYFLQTDKQFGQTVGEKASANPMLADSGVEINGHKLPVNDVFRAVHDFFGHGKEGYQFGPRGELNAWRAHSEMFSPEAQGALAAETLAQNSWVNFGEHLRDEAGNIPKRGEPGFINPADRPFGEQKNIVVPDALIKEARGGYLPGEEDVRPLDDRWHVVWKPRAEGKTTLRQTVHAASAEEAQQKAGVPEGAHIVSTEPVYAPGMRREGYLPKKGRETEAEAKKRVEETDYSKYNTPAEQKAVDAKATGWVLPNGKYVPLDTNYHQTWLGENADKLNKQFGTELTKDATEDDRLAALNAGFVRVRNYGGKMVIEANIDKFDGARRKAINNLVDRHAENVDSIRVSLLDENGEVADSIGEQLHEMSDPRKVAREMLDHLRQFHTPKEETAPKKGPSNIQIARSRGGYLPENIPPQGTPGFNDYAESLVAKAKSFPEVLPPELRRDKAGNVRAAWDGEPLFAAQEWDLFNTPLAKKSGSVDAFTTDLSKKMEEEYNSIKDRPELKGAEQWYELCRTKLREVLKTPEDIKLFGELLGATSPQQKVAPNFSDAVAAFNQIKSGAYDDMVAKYREGKAKFAAKDPEAMADFQKEASASAVKSGQLSDFLYWWADKHDLVPKKANGAKYGMNSRAVMKVLDGTWMESVEGPKTPSFTGNLIGLWFKGIVDKWAMRTMTRLSSEGQPWRIIHQAETGISNPEYFAGEKAFQEAADRIGIKPDALQAILWVNEQRLWEENGWARAGAQHGATYQGLLEHTTKTPEGKLEFTPPKPPKKVKSKVAKIVESQ